MPLIIDSHQHFWKYDPIRHSWITNEMKLIRRDFLPEDLFPVLHQNNVNGCVTVQVDQTESETNFLLQLADENKFIKGVVGWVNLQAENIEERLDHFSFFKKLKGFRHIVQAEPEDDFLLRDQFCRGIASLNKYYFTYDILIYPRHLPYATRFVKKFPEQKFVIDHLAKPAIKQMNIEEWKQEITLIAQFKNVYCKISGLVTESDWDNWEKDDFKPYLDVVTESFGINRIMFGSDWPVCLIAAKYDEVLGIVTDYFSSYSKNEQDLLFGENARAFYRLD